MSPLCLTFCMWCKLWTWRMQLNHCQSYNGVQALGSTIEVINVQGISNGTQVHHICKMGKGRNWNKYSWASSLVIWLLQIVKNARALLLIQSGCLFQGGNCHVGNHLGFIFVALVVLFGRWHRGLCGDVINDSSLKDSWTPTLVIW